VYKRYKTHPFSAPQIQPTSCRPLSLRCILILYTHKHTSSERPISFRFSDQTLVCFVWSLMNATNSTHLELLALTILLFHKQYKLCSISLGISLQPPGTSSFFFWLEHSPSTFALIQPQAINFLTTVFLDTLNPHPSLNVRCLVPKAYKHHIKELCNFQVSGWDTEQ
jgi:hypothetical protein